MPSEVKDMKHTAITTDGITVALERITVYDLVGYPVPIACTHKQFKKESALWIELFDKTWPHEVDQVVGNMA